MKLAYGYTFIKPVSTKTCSDSTLLLNIAKYKLKLLRVHIVVTSATLNVCLAKKFVKQYFLLNSLMKLGCGVEAPTLSHSRLA